MFGKLALPMKTKFNRCFVTVTLVFGLTGASRAQVQPPAAASEQECSR